ncbi:MAG: cytochrome c biogenesis protein CcdA [Bacteroidetes bacterium]|nr:cytochrome c biogenesis protein CcdA [Bacteroidota bacterium]MCL5739165.1 cytochrome c biogenesis protein CcdA [Bacteroidota bacterium]
MENVNILTAFIFGIISFISPCVLPIVPGYLSFISGYSFDEMVNSSRSELFKKVTINSILFIIGFSLIFVTLGASATAVGRFLVEKMDFFSKIAGAIIMIFGLHMTGIFKIKFLNYEKKFHSDKKIGPLGSFVAGLAFAFGWTPCIGPVLAAILAIAAQQDTIGKGIVLLSAYSLGLGIPFLITSLSINAFLAFFKKFSRYIRWVEIGGGVLLILVGFLIMTNNLTVLSSYFAKWFPFLNELS